MGNIPPYGVDGAMLPPPSRNYNQFMNPRSSVNVSSLPQQQLGGSIHKSITVAQSPQTGYMRPESQQHNFLSGIAARNIHYQSQQNMPPMMQMQ
jgi:hypothetical protein